MSEHKSTGEAADAVAACLSDICGVGRSLSGLVTATVGGDGRPQALKIDERAMHLTAHQLEEELLSALRAAYRDAEEQAGRFLEDYGADFGGPSARSVLETVQQAADDIGRKVAEVTNDYDEVRRRLFDALDNPRQ